MKMNLDLTKILANVPKGTKLFCPEYGYVELCEIVSTSAYPIRIETNDGTSSFTKDGYFVEEKYRDEYAEPSLFPAHDQRDWSKFEVPKNKVKVTLHPFDRVLARLYAGGTWIATLITDIDKEGKDAPYLCLRNWYEQCISYNKDTAHLIGTNEDCPIDYEIEFSKEFKEE